MYKSLNVQACLACELSGQTKKNGDKTATDDSESKEGQTTEATTIEQAPIGTTVSGNLVTNVSRGVPNSHQSIKRSASGDPVTKQPPGKKKKL